uniref:DNA-directed RNA polymerase subunit n=1 Tax=Nitzschia sp. PL3-2 TaxID=2083271 RepID=A0A2Z5ZAR9_9STRA|nr:RNA polymerase beta' subunit [Nitzschia sp. PL3-2]
MENYDYLKITLASPTQILKWSHKFLSNGNSIGEVLTTDTIDFKTFKIQNGGLFCQRIFGPVKSYKCACGKYKSFRNQKIICEQCGVEIINSQVRRYRMGYIKLRFPIFHFWYLKSKPNILGLLLEVEGLEKRLKTNIRGLNSAQKAIVFSQFWDKRIKNIKISSIIYAFSEDQIYVYGLHWQLEQYRKSRKKGYSNYSIVGAKRNKELEKKAKKINPILYEGPPISLTGSSLIYKELKALNINTEIFKTRCFILVCSKVLEKEKPFYFQHEWSEDWEYQRITKIKEEAIQRIRILENFKNTGSHPSWLALTILPVLAPDLRPILFLDNGVIIGSDLNEVYKLIIMRNNRVDDMIQLGMPGVFLKNERRAVQEAVDTLIDNKKRSIPYYGMHDSPLTSISDSLRGKTGRLRQNLLGKRVNFSGRSVIVVEPKLKLNQCGLPYEMALELFKPFIIYEFNKKNGTLFSQIKKLEIDFTLKKKDSVKIEEKKPKSKRIFFKTNLFQINKSEILPILLKILANHPIFLNRAPTLHKLGIQSFEPILVEGRAIKLHPSVCSAYNADFDGDQMGIHIPLTLEAQAESYNTMFAPYNLLSSATGEPTMTPTQDMILGCSYLTISNIKNLNGSNHYFSELEDVLKAYSQNRLELHSNIWVRYKEKKLNSLNILKVIKLKDNSYIEYYTNLQIRKNFAGKIIVQYLKTTTGKVILNYTIYKILNLL